MSLSDNDVAVCITNQPYFKKSNIHVTKILAQLTVKDNVTVIVIQMSNILFHLLRLALLPNLLFVVGKYNAEI
jgi:hypothetical protein